jgi:hypothetical protein
MNAKKIISIITASAIITAAGLSTTAIKEENNLLISSAALSYENPELAEYAKQVAILVNRERSSYGLQPVKYSPLLSDAANVRSSELRKNFSHTRPNHNNYPSDEKMRECFLKYSQVQSVTDSYKNLVSNGSISVGHTILETEKAPILCETYRFTSLGAYLYFELFKCIEEKYMPVKCSNCGRWFIMKHTTFSHFCTRAVSSNPIKTCRDVGFRKSYAEKIKSDPVWLIYTRAYKQHYARFMKKTMSKTEFAEWAEYALDLRQKALDGEIGIEEYTELIRK